MRVNATSGSPRAHHHCLAQSSQCQPGPAPPASVEVENVTQNVTRLVKTNTMQWSGSQEGRREWRGAVPPTTGLRARISAPCMEQ